MNQKLSSWLIAYLSPAVSEVYDENELDEYEEEASHQPEVHPHLAEVAVGHPRDPEGSNHPADDQEIFESPKTVLDPGSKNRKESRSWR